MIKIDTQHLDDLALGSVFLATGGGGDPYIPKLITKQALKKFGPVTVVKPQDIDDDALVVTIGAVGAPTVSLELLPSLEETVNTLDAYEKYIGRKVDAVVSFEIGGGNSLIPLVAAAAKNIPVIDGDGMGRALPEAQMMSYAIAGVKPTPALASDYAGNTAIFSTSTTTVYERHIRNYAMAAGGMITAAEHPMSGRELKASVIPETLSFSIALGKVLRDNRGPASDILEPLQNIFENSIYGECHHIFSGKITDKSTRIVGGYDIGVARIESFETGGPSLSVDIKNEYLLARLDGKTVTSVPDLIIIVDYETSTPINAERLRYGQRVTVFAVGCPAFYRTKNALGVVAPKCFGFDMDYTPLEELL